MAEKQVEKVSDWHRNLIEYLIANPRATLRELSREFGVTIGWLSVIKNSDSFRAELEKRREEHSGYISATVADKLTAVAEVTLEEILERFDGPDRASIPLSGLRDIADVSLKSLGFGAKAGGNTSPVGGDQYNFYVTDKETLATARQRMAALHTQQPQVINYEPSESVEVDPSGAEAFHSRGGGD